MMRLALICSIAFIATGCAVDGNRKVRFVEAPYCTLLADGVEYRFHRQPGAADALTRAAFRWREKRVSIRSKEAVEFNCLRWVQAALEKAGKTIDYRTDD
ncbi:MAG: hypothetical protein ABIO43_04345 [Sphingomicrobium sp.]